MIVYRLKENSTSYDEKSLDEFANVFMKEDVILWAKDVIVMLDLGKTLANENINEALYILEEKNEFLVEETIPVIHH